MSAPKLIPIEYNIEGEKYTIVVRYYDERVAQGWAIYHKSRGRFFNKSGQWEIDPRHITLITDISDSRIKYFFNTVLFESAEEAAQWYLTTSPSSLT